MRDFFAQRRDAARGAVTIAAGRDGIAERIENRRGGMEIGFAEFGEDSFMLAMASYNRGESGVRRVLHQIASEPGGFKKERRDFWHLYRLKKLPEETREYVPKVLAAAIVSMNAQKYGLEAAKGDDD